MPPLLPLFLRRLHSVSICLLALPAAATAQQMDDAPGPFVVDVRGAWSSVGRSDALARPRGLQATELPTSVLGLELGAHVYPIRGRVTLGVGASFLTLGGTQSPGEPEPDVVSPAVATGEFRARGVVPQLSLNFGSSRGWSYLGAGLGLLTIQAGRAESDLTYGPSLRTLHYGGGARWFVSEHVAFTFDGRFYRLASKPLEADYLGNPALSMFVFSAGVSLK